MSNDDKSASDTTVAPEGMEVRRSSRDPGELGAGLEAWLAVRLGSRADPRVVDLSGTSTNGMSSETIVFDAEWSGNDGRETHKLVARLAPRSADVPVFPSYDLGRQFEIIRAVGQRTGVPVPDTYWYEPDPAAIGTQFFVMSRVEGVVPPDLMPYTFGDNWLFDAPADRRRRLQESTVATFAALHGMPLDERITTLLAYDEPDATPLERHVAHTRAWYEWAVGDGPRSPLLDEAFGWLDDRLPRAVAGDDETVVSWGDARIGNIIYDDFEPAAVLDWEMVGLGPRELDVAFLINAHDVFQHIAENFGLHGMPEFLRAEDVVTSYQGLTGHEIRDLDWHLTYAAVRFGIAFLRTGQRQIHFGEIEPPGSLDDLMHHKNLLAAKLRR